MVLAHTIVYALARGVPAALNFLAVAVFTRVLSPNEYGIYAVGAAAVGLVYSGAFQWLSLAAARFTVDQSAARQQVKGAIIRLFLWAGGLIVLAALVWLIVGDGRGLSALEVIIVAITALLYGWTEISLELARARFSPGSYCIGACLRALLFLGAGLVLTRAGLGGVGLLTALLLANAAASLILMREWRGARRVTKSGQLTAITGYALPFTVIFACSYAIGSMGRFFLLWLHGDAAAGVYAAVYDVTWALVSLPLGVLNLAFYPAIVREFERGEGNGAAVLLRQCGEVVIVTAVIMYSLATFLATVIADVALGSAFREHAQEILGPVALAAALYGVLVYYLWYGFHLARDTYGQIWIVGGSLLAGAPVTYFAIASFGLRGAAFASLATYVFMLIGVVGRRSTIRPSLDWKVLRRPLLVAGVLWLLLGSSSAWLSMGSNVILVLYAGLSVAATIGLCYVAEIQRFIAGKWSRPVG